MGREAKLRRKNGHWYSEAGGQPRYFGKVAEVPHAEALRRFREGLLNLPELGSPSLSVRKLVDQFLAWVEEHRGERTYRERARHLKRWVSLWGSKPATQIRGGHLEALQDRLRKEGAAEDYVKKHATSVRACFNRASRMGWLPGDFRPFASVEPIHLPAKSLSESELPTDEEVQALLEAAGPLRDMIACYYHTGARTAELVAARVGDFQHKTRQLLIRSHKRSRTMKDPVPRRIILNEATYATLAKLCRGQQADESIFLSSPSGRPWDVSALGHAFAKVRRKAGVREIITIYSFRHLWISEALMAGVDVLLVAKMAGTSVAMIERVYGHFRCQSFHEAQTRLDGARQTRPGAGEL